MERDAVLFDLDNTLFDHDHSVQAAMAAVQKEHVRLSEFALSDLVFYYNIALDQTYDRYLDYKLTHEEIDMDKVTLFFTLLGLDAPSPDEIQRFRTIYKRVYRKSRRATPGTVETLTRLREHGYLGIITNGRTADQVKKAKAIGVRHLVDHITTSEEVGYKKPDPRIFQHAMSRFGVPLRRVFMVGDSPEADIKGALAAGVQPFLYSPIVKDGHCSRLEGHVPVIRRIDEILTLFQIPP